jgi:hypothetical protein
MDNCSTHVRPIIQEIIHAAGHLIKHLPPYSPDFNPTGLTFGILKAFIPRNFWLQREEFESFLDYLAWCIDEVVVAAVEDPLLPLLPLLLS